MFERIRRKSASQIYVRLTDAEMDWIEEQARIREVSRQEILREALSVLYKLQVSVETGPPPTWLERKDREAEL